MVIYTTKNLQQYIDRVTNQKEVMNLSPGISSSTKKMLCDTYDLQIEIATTEMQLIKAKNIEVVFELVGTSLVK